MKFVILCLALVAAALAMPLEEKKVNEPAIPSLPQVASNVDEAKEKLPVSPPPTVIAEKKSEDKIIEKPGTKGEPAIPVIESKPETDPKPPTDQVPELKSAVPETNLDSLPQIDSAKSNVASNVPVAQSENKSPESAVKSVPEVIAKAQKVPEIKSDVVSQENDKLIPTDKSNALSGVNVEQSKDKNGGKSDEKTAKVVEVAKEEVKSTVQLPVDVVKAANELAGVADDAVNPAVFISKPEKKIDLPVVGEKSAIPVELPKTDEKKMEKTPIAQKPEQKPSVKLNKPDSENSKPSEIPATKNASPASSDSKASEIVDDTLRVVRDTVDDQQVSKSIVEKKSVEKVEDKLQEKSEITSEVDVNTSKVETSEQSKETSETKQVTKSEEPSKNTEIPKIPAVVKSEIGEIHSEVKSEIPQIPAAVKSENPQIPAAVKSEIPQIPAAVQSEIPQIPAAVKSEIPQIPSAVKPEIPKSPEKPKVPESSEDLLKKEPVKKMETKDAQKQVPKEDRSKPEVINSQESNDSSEKDSSEESSSEEDKIATVAKKIN